MGIFKNLFGSSNTAGNNRSVQEQMQAITTRIVNELIVLTPKSMNQIQFEIISTSDGGADIGLIDNHPDVKHVALSDLIYREASSYLPLVKKHIPNWSRSLITLTESGSTWKVEVDFERA